MDYNKNALDQIMRGINIMLNHYIDNYTTQIYTGIVKDQIGNKWAIEYNGEIHNMSPYKIVPQKNDIVKVIIPNGNQNLGFFI